MEKNGNFCKNWKKMEILLKKQSAKICLFRKFLKIFLGNFLANFTKKLDKKIKNDRIKMFIEKLNIILNFVFHYLIDIRL